MGFKLPKLPSISDTIRNPIRSIEQTWNAFGGTSSNMLTAIYDNPLAADLYDDLRGAERESVRQERYAKDEEANKQEAERVQAYNDALGAKDIDETTRSEIQNLFNSGASAAEIGRLLGAAREGKGVYGARRIVENRRRMAAEFPGRQQTVLSLGQGTVLGGGRGY